MAAVNNFVLFLFTLSTLFFTFGFTGINDWEKTVVKLSGKVPNGSVRSCHGVAVTSQWILTIRACVINLTELTAQYYDGTEEKLRLNEMIDERYDAKADYNDYTLLKIKKLPMILRMPCLTPDDVRERYQEVKCSLEFHKVKIDGTWLEEINSTEMSELDGKICSKMLKEENEEWLLSDSEDCYISTINRHFTIAPSYDAHPSQVGAPMFCSFKGSVGYYLLGIVGRVWPVQQLVKSFPIVVALSHDRYDWLKSSLHLNHLEHCVYEDMSEFEIENVRYSPATRTTRGLSSNKKPFIYLITLLILLTILTN